MIARYRAIPLMALLMLASVLSRLMPHPPNVTAQMAITLFAAWHLPERFAMMSMVACLIASDLALATVYHLPAMGTWSLVNVLAYALIVYLNRPTPSEQQMTLLRCIACTLSASSLFWCISNLGVWLSSSLYSHTLTGLITCYQMAIPFLCNSVMGDLFWLTLISLSTVRLRALCPQPLKISLNAS